MSPRSVLKWSKTNVYISYFFFISPLVYIDKHTEIPHVLGVDKKGPMGTRPLERVFLPTCTGYFTILFSFWITVSYDVPVDVCLSTQWDWTELAASLHTIFSHLFSWQNTGVFWFKFYWNSFLRRNENKSALVQVMNRLAPNRRQAITWNKKNKSTNVLSATKELRLHVIYTLHTSCLHKMTTSIYISLIILNPILSTRECNNMHCNN